MLLELYALCYGEALKEEEGSYGGKDLSAIVLSAPLSVYLLVSLSVSLRVYISSRRRAWGTLYTGTPGHRNGAVPAL